MADASHVQSKPGEKAPRYRASCDSCNEAKVRCSQTRPSCARCLKSQNRRCVYGISKRFGRHNGEISMKVEGGVRNSTVARYPARSTSTTGIKTPSSSSSTVDPRDLLRLSPESEADPSDFLGGQQLPKNWPFDSNLYMPTRATMSPANDGHYQSIFGGDEIDMSSVQDHGLGLFDATSDTELGSCSDDGSSGEQPPSYGQSNTNCASCSTSYRQDDRCSRMDTCRCTETIITCLSSLPVLLRNNQCSTFDVELVQFQSAVRLCAGALACQCPGKDYTSILTISTLIARIISVFERNGAQTGRNDHHDHNSARSLLMTGALTPVPSPKFSVGIYEIEGEDESNLKREVWWIQIRKVESLIAAFKDMVAKMTQQQVYQDTSAAAGWEKLAVMLDEKTQAVKRDWRVYRDQA